MASAPEMDQLEHARVSSGIYHDGPEASLIGEFCSLTSAFLRESVVVG